MREIADGVWQLSGWPPNNVNVYVVGDVLIDAGLAIHRARILRQIADRQITANALTHAHLDHFGSSHAICEQLGIPLWCGAEDAQAVEAGKLVVEDASEDQVQGCRALGDRRLEREPEALVVLEVFDLCGRDPSPARQSEGRLRDFQLRRVQLDRLHGTEDPNRDGLLPLERESGEVGSQLDRVFLRPDGVRQTVVRFLRHDELPRFQGWLGEDPICS